MSSLPSNDPPPLAGKRTEPAISPERVVGVQPWFPWPLSRWKWWTRPVRAERLAALRIGVALVLLLDVLGTYIPDAAVFFGADSLGSPELFRWWLEPEWQWKAIHDDLGEIHNDFAKGKPFDRTLDLRWRWSLLKGVESPRWVSLTLWLWAGATLLLLVGLGTRVSALVVWVLSTSVANVNPYIDNAGDVIRGIMLFYLVFCPCGAAWSIDAWLKQRGKVVPPTYIHPWPLRLLFLQMVMIYWCNGLYKLTGPDWQAGKSLYYVLGDLTLTRWSYAQVQIPYLITRIMTWTVLGWEVAFPLLVCWRPTRIAALWFGVAFHLGIGLTMELGGFVPYVLCLYLPLIPWERWSHKPR